MCKSRRPRVVEAGLVHLQVQEPAEHQIIIEPLTEHALAAHRVQRHQQRGLERPPGRNRGHPTALYIWSNNGESCLSVPSANCLMRRIGWSLVRAFPGRSPPALPAAAALRPALRLSSSASNTHFDELYRDGIQAFINSLLEDSRFTLPPLDRLQAA